VASLSDVAIRSICFGMAHTMTRSNPLAIVIHNLRALAEHDDPGGLDFWIAEQQNYQPRSSG
jgi:hypothetical protein